MKTKIRESEYKPLLDYYKESNYKIFSLDNNCGYAAIWDSSIYENFFKNSFYIYTDSDMELAEDCPKNFIDIMLFNLWRHKRIDKIGLSIKIDDIPDHYNKKQKVLEWEKRNWEIKFDNNLYNANVDTTFALYRKNKIGPDGCLKALRLVPPYSIRHLPWYENSNDLEEEFLYYFKNPLDVIKFWE